MSNPPSNDNQAVRPEGTALGSASFFIGLFLIIVPLPLWFFIGLGAALTLLPEYITWAFITALLIFLLSASGVVLGVTAIRQETQSKAFAITGIVINGLALVFSTFLLLTRALSLIPLH